MAHSREGQTKDVPRGALYGAAALIVLAIVAALVGHLTGSGVVPPTAAPVASRDLTFQDRADGSILVTDARTKAEVTMIAPETNGFLRATLRGLANRRKFAGSTDAVFHLTAWADGRLTLIETSGKVIDLEAFGRTNEEAFARLLDFHGAAS